MPHFDTSSFITTYFPIPFFLVLVAGYAFTQKSKMVKNEEMDFFTGCSADIPNEAAPKGIWAKLNEYV